MNDKINWHERFNHQLKWTKNLRKYIFTKMDLKQNKKLLEIGCGTGALLEELGQNYEFELHGIDIDANRLIEAKKNLTDVSIKATLYEMDILKNTFESDSFDLVVTHLVILWIDDLDTLFEELHRIIKPDGYLIIFCEPDYGGMIENPDTNLKTYLSKNLKDLGADPDVGRKLGANFSKNNRFSVIEPFSLSVPWLANSDEMKENLLKECDFYENLLGESWNPQPMKNAILNGQYFLYNPAFGWLLRNNEL